MPHKAFYFPKASEHLFRKFKEIADREGRSMSEILEELVRDYVRIHEPGNPQTRLDVILGITKDPVPRCSECGDPAERVYRLRGLSVFRCKEHRMKASRVTGPIGWKEL